MVLLKHASIFVQLCVTYIYDSEINNFGWQLVKVTLHFGLDHFSNTSYKWQDSVFNNGEGNK